MRIRRAIAALLAPSLLAPGAATAQAKGKDDARKAPARKVLTAEELKVEGKVRRPTAVLITAPAPRRSVDPESAESFLPKVLKPLGKEPF